MNIFSLLKKNEITRTYTGQGQSINILKKDLPSSKEWYNSAYAFNKKSLRFLPAIHEYVFKLFRAYFNLVSEKMETDTTSRKYKKNRRSSGHKTWVSTPEIKLLNKEVNITIYVYNRTYNVYKNKLNQLGFSWGPTLEQITHEQKRELSIRRKKITVKPTKITADYLDDNLTKKISHEMYNRSKNPFALKINHRSFSTNTKILNEGLEKSTIEIDNSSNILSYPKKIKHVKQEHTSFAEKDKTLASANFYYLEIIKWLKLNKIIKMKSYKTAVARSTGVNTSNLFENLNILRLDRYNYLINQFSKELVYLKLKQKLMFNQYKLTELYTEPIIKVLQKIYNRKVKLNIITLKNYYLNSSILLQMIKAKLKKSRARGRHLVTIDRAMSRIKIPQLSSNKLQRLDKRNIEMQNVILSNYGIKSDEDNINQFLINKYTVANNDVHKLVLKNLENKSISGLFIKISGRLTKRYKAQRAISSLRARGTLKNVRSAHSGLSSTLSRGYSNINVEKSMLHSKNRIGAYGLTGWIASY